MLAISIGGKVAKLITYVNEMIPILFSFKTGSLCVALVILELAL